MNRVSRSLQDGQEFVLDGDDAFILLMKTSMKRDVSFDVSVNGVVYHLEGTRVSRRALREMADASLPLNVIVYTGKDFHPQFCVTKVVPMWMLVG